MRHSVSVLLTVFAVTASVAAQERQPSPAGSSVLRQFIASIPSTAPAEFTADLLLRAADSEQADAEGHDWLISTYERAFALAGQAPVALSRRMLPWGHPDTREAMRRPDSNTDSIPRRFRPGRCRACCASSRGAHWHFWNTSHFRRRR